ncbi:MAG: cytochrome c3 family protein [Kofleriaceae bacterium]|nr:cytochrome c3 family protein [Kofleriaceae bacterium]
MPGRARPPSSPARLLWPLALLFALSLAAAPWSRATPTLPGLPAPVSPNAGSVIYPAQRLPLTFDHGRHLARGATCLDCHAGAATSRSAVDRLLPDEATCARCHPIDRQQPTRQIEGQPPAACGACHPGFQPDVAVARVEVPTANLKFSHAAHVTTPCARCHGDLTRVGLATTAHLPSMPVCLDCHRAGGARKAEPACGTCHLTSATGTLRTALVDGPLVPTSAVFGDAHGPGFATRHAGAARRGGATCASCHQQEFCADCHLGVARPMAFHRGDYASSHAIEARRGVPDCSACHRVASFCVGCHERVGVGARGPSGFEQGAADPARRFHPAGWGGVGGRHGGEARRNLEACASCHRDDFCVTCHAPRGGGPAGGPAVSPHPPGWRGSVACQALDRKNRRMCLRCHVTADQLGCDWRAGPAGSRLAP